MDWGDNTTTTGTMLTGSPFGTCLSALDGTSLHVSGGIVCDSLIVGGVEQQKSKKSSLAHYLKQARLRK